MLAWRAFRDSLPISSKLERRGVLEGGPCPWCGVECEDLLHFLLQCHFAHLVSALSHLPWSLISDPSLIQRSGFMVFTGIFMLGVLPVRCSSACVNGALVTGCCSKMSLFLLKEYLSGCRAWSGTCCQAILKLDGALKAYQGSCFIGGT
ncbi:UNVERIFIED_CONTAM: hypothetical protein Slati_2682800 [Sesamum latifolium]|uniref:Reverse transcriptase zinc-binding domain-containing protein n=1 Tax=Sesamum latifolium TaxID=2727402 RepID=A0AAW2VZM7_9LAMI